MKLEFDRKDPIDVRRIVIETSEGIRFTISECHLTNGLIVNKNDWNDSSIKITPKVSNEIELK